MQENKDKGEEKKQPIQVNNPFNKDRINLYPSYINKKGDLFINKQIIWTHHHLNQELKTISVSYHVNGQ